MIIVGLCVLLLGLIQSVGYSDDLPPDNGRRAESVLITGHGIVALASVLRKSLRRFGVPIAAVMGATAYFMRTMRLAQTPDASNFEVAMNAAFIPLTVMSVMYGVPAFAGGWRSLLPFAVKGGGTWRDKLVSLNFLVAIGIYGVTDTAAHIRKGINPLTSKAWLINRLYTIFGAVLTANALHRSGTLIGRVQGTMAMSIAYSLFNSFVQEWYYVLKADKFEVEQIKFDQMWGGFHSAPRNLIDWTIWNFLAGKAANTQSAAVVGSLLSMLRVADALQRSHWYATSKLVYLHDDKSFFCAVFRFRCKP